MKRKLDEVINEYSDIFSKDDKYDIGMSTCPLVEIPTEEPPCIYALYIIPLKSRPWADNTINKLLEAGIIQCMMSTWASPVIIISKKGLEVKLEDTKEPLPVDAKLRLVCDYHKLNQKLPADFWSYDKELRSKASMCHTHYHALTKCWYQSGVANFLQPWTAQVHFTD